MNFDDEPGDERRSRQAPDVAGQVDVAQRTRAVGWAMPRRGPSGDVPAEVTVSLAPTVHRPRIHLATILANGYRADLDPSGIGVGGRVGFDVDLRGFGLPRGSFLLDVHRGRRRLNGSPAFIPALGFEPPAATLRLVELDGTPVCSLPPDVVCHVARVDGRVRVTLPPGSHGLMVCSAARSSPGDARLLGAALRRIELDGAELDLGSPALAYGFHAPEGNEAGRWRWMEDAAFIGVGASGSPQNVTLELTGVRTPPPREAGLCGISARFRLVGIAESRLAHVGGRFLTAPELPHRRPAAPA